ncbi:MAG: hypothetical protein A3G39_08470 [Deltaproteobacteria bacterium RIFCSPLOWO2_12_FULL_43_16]|nr:MAG: hypothetical protein A2Z89_04500 [Deltaproteobacteria bacterium GWA2_43_19]OGQ13071.1 MAG: hypothetical protein A3D30_07130 [Deltaproteobacteria bacterium RIFCSPHIGHO2_02_FULL_43_33]OGQ44344.1 MAG: hypothetical protein A3A85_04605 [Deltaproteobacteria bacterium RIFCSPLOWO2_01_FULL_42_9]OGQ57366.1 MAG: hypothetical protein A3G39_08470 [Deltaproteobacteria bacterium RIFCSPLOWO2_12_FULL_43_16]HBR17541.1 hypothetical protein [Deltaproteobacteria bacterium]
MIERFEKGSITIFILQVESFTKVFTVFTVESLKYICVANKYISKKIMTICLIRMTKCIELFFQVEVTL